MTKPQRILWFGLFLFTQVGCGFVTGTRGGDPLVPVQRPINHSPAPILSAPGATAGPGMGPLTAAPQSYDSLNSRNFDGPVPTGVPLNENQQTTNAAMAASLGQPSVSDLRIGNTVTPTTRTRKNQGAQLPTSAPIQMAKNETSPAWLEYTVPPTNLRGPTPKADPPPIAAGPRIVTVGAFAESPITPGAAMPTPIRIRTVEEGQKKVKELGAIWQKLEQVNGGDWQFSCVTPNQQNVLVNRRHEARDRDQLSAIQLVIDQIQRDQSPER